MTFHSPIRLLPEHLIDQIKAGEVVERPAALIKEILENSLDAGSKHLSLHIIDNGLELISLEDDGQGMSYEDLPYAFARHATSKIFDYADLFKLSSYGFRGEALASIASVSRINCTSAKADGHGGKIEINGGETISHTPIEGAPKGTSLFISDLFYNTPARLKFVKSKTVEKNALKRTIDAFLLTARDTTFSVRFDDQDKKIFPACKDEKSFIKRLERIFYKRKDLNSSNALTYEGRREFEGHKIEIHISTQATPGNSGKQQFLFANGRLFNDKRLHQMISRSMPNLWGNDSGHYACFLTIPHDQIDVNVHPNKTEVKFMREDIIFAMLKAALKDFDALALPMESTSQEESAQNKKLDWRRFEHDYSQTDSTTSLSTPESPKRDESEVHNSTKLPNGYRWLAGHNNVIVDESALVRQICQKVQNNKSGFVPLLINEPIFWEDQSLDIARLNSLGFELEWIESKLLALRSVASWLRPLPYLELCRHAINHVERDEKELYKDFELHAPLPDAIYGRLIASYDYQQLENLKVARALDKHTLQRLFSK